MSSIVTARSEPADTTQRWHDTHSAADFLGCSGSLLSKLRNRGTGPRFYKRGTGRFAPVRYLESDLSEWAMQFKFTSTSQYTGDRRTSPHDKGAAS